jgi:hypothetical protein
MSVFNKSRGIEQDILKKDLNKLGTAGLSANQISQQRMQAGDAAGRDVAVYQSLLNQQSMTNPTNPQLQGQFAKVSADQAGAASDAAATIGAQANELSAQITQQKDSQIKADLLRDSEERQQRGDKIVDTAATTGQKFIPGTQVG